MEEVTQPQITFIPYPTLESAQAKVAEIDAKYRKPWEERSTSTYAIPLERIDGKFYLPIYSWTWEDFSEAELSRGVSELPEAKAVEESL